MRILLLYDVTSISDNSPPKQTVFLLTPKEKAMLPLICKGYTNKAIAGYFGTKLGTVKTQINTLMKVTNSQNRTELAVNVLTHNITLGVLNETI